MKLKISAGQTCLVKTCILGLKLQYQVNCINPVACTKDYVNSVIFRQWWSQMNRNSHES